MDQSRCIKVKYSRCSGGISLKILTLNCHSWQEEKQIEKIKYLAKVINENNYDVIAMQEVSQSIDSDIVMKV